MDDLARDLRPPPRSRGRRPRDHRRRDRPRPLRPRAAQHAPHPRRRSADPRSRSPAAATTRGPDGMPFPDEWRATSDDMYGVVLPPVVGTDFPPARRGPAGPGHRRRAGAGHDRRARAVDDAPGPVRGPSRRRSRRWPGSTRWRAPSTSPATWPPAGDRAVGRRSSGTSGADPDSFADVLALDVPVTLVPLDATDDVPVPADIVDRLATDHAAAGADITYETYARTPVPRDRRATTGGTPPRPRCSPTRASGRGRTRRSPSTSAAGSPATLPAARPDRRRRRRAAGHRRGARRPPPRGARARIRSRSREPSSVTWDGTTCRRDGETPTTAGLTRVEIHNRVRRARRAARGRRPRPEDVGRRPRLDQRRRTSARRTSSIPDWIVQIARARTCPPRRAPTPSRWSTCQPAPSA